MSEKKAQVLILDPPVDLVFKGPFTEVVTSQLTLQNPSNEQVIFKVKTTAPKQYCVRPNSGLLKSQEMATISVMLQPFEYNAADKSKHKFMVQTMYAPPGFKVESLDAVWKDANKSQLMDSKLRCVFVEESEETGVISGNVPNQTPVITEPSLGSRIKIDAPSSPKPEEENTAVVSGNAGSNIQSNAGSTPARVPPPEKEMEKAAVESKVRMLQDKIDQLSSENAQLKSEGNKLRQRLGPGVSAASGSLSAGTSGMRPPRPPKQGSLSLLAIMFILVAIILGYLVGKWL